MIRVPTGASLTSVRDSIRALPPAKRACGIEVRLSAGVYELDGGLALDARDSGLPTAPVVWCGAADGGTELVGGRAIPPAAFHPDPLRKGVFVADLSDWKTAWPERPKRAVTPYPVAELYIDGRRMLPAGWPNLLGDDPDGWDDGWSTFDTVENCGTNRNECGTFVYRTLRPDRWADEKYGYLSGFWKVEWSADEVPICSIDVTAKTITLGGHHFYGLGGINRFSNRPRRWRAMNLLCELDAPGEAYLDVETSRLYVMPRRPFGSATRIRICWRDADLVSLTGVGNVTLRDIGFGPAWQCAISGAGVTNVVLENLRISNTHDKAIRLLQASHCRIADCEMHDLGAGGIHLTGGDRRTLTPGGNVIENNLIHDFSTIQRTYAWAIYDFGVGDVIRHNEICNAIHEGMNVDGNDMTIEYNVISNVVKGTDDSGAFHCGRNISCRGNVLRHNLFAHVGNSDYRTQTGVYFDDGHSGWTVEGCVFEDVRRNSYDPRGFGAVHCNGGYSNVVRNCLFIDCPRALGSRWVEDKEWHEWLASPGWIRRLKEEVDIESDVYLAHYPELRGAMKGLPKGERLNLCEDNVVVNGWQFSSGLNWSSNRWNVMVKQLPPGDRNAACRALIPHFKPIPYERIGRRPASRPPKPQSRYRAPEPTWPPHPITELNGRRIEFFTHGAKPEWGYGKEAGENVFAVQHPSVPQPCAPLVVVLHSAGHNLMTCLSCVRQNDNHDIYTVPDGMYALYLDCKVGSRRDWWWGYSDPADKAFGESPLERRVMDTVRWVRDAYPVDVNRIYLCGNSMGASGTLGIGLRHGDVFAAIKANTPAGVGHACARIGVPPVALPDGVTLPEPPVCVDYSSQTDRWSVDHDRLVRAMGERRWPYLFFWGAFGHANRDRYVAQFNDIVHDFDWLSVRRDDPCPAFTRASSDNTPPWPVKAVKDATDAKDLRPGQVNGYFRWKNVSCDATKIEIDLFLANPKTEFKELVAPERATADVALRRLGAFGGHEGGTVRWSYAGKSGTLKADRPLAFPGLEIVRTPRRLTVTRQ